MQINPFFSSPILFVISLAISISACLYHKHLKEMPAFPGLLATSAGLILASMLNDLMPHLVGHHEHTEVDTHKHEFYPGILTAGITFIILLLLEKVFSQNGHGHTHSHEPDENVVQIQIQPPNNENENEKFRCCGKNTVRNSVKFKAISFILIISIHGLLEGLGKMDLSRLIALYLHKAFESFSIGVTLGCFDLSLIFSFVLCGFNSLITPVGLLVGEISSAESFSWFVDGLGFGALLFVTFFEILPPVWKSEKSPYFLIFFLSVGFLLPFGVNPLIDVVNEKLVSN